MPDLKDKCLCTHIYQRHHEGPCRGFLKDINGKKYACPCAGYNSAAEMEERRQRLFCVTEAQVIAGWEKYGNGTPLKPGFAKYLSDELSKPFPMLPFTRNCDADFVNETIGFQVGMMAATT